MSILSMGRRKLSDPLWLFAIEGALLQYVIAINGFGNNLFATHLGATDAQIGLTQTVPNAVAVILMLPLGILANRARSSRTVPLYTLLAMVAGFVLLTAVPLLGSARMLLFFVALAVTVGGPVIYNAQWQNFFGDVVAPEGRNDVLTLRNKFMFFIGIAAPILCGLCMGLKADSQWKVLVLQIFFAVCGGAALIQAGVVSRIPAPIRESTKATSGLGEVKRTLHALSGCRPFLLFFVPAVLFYITWQMDWSMWYIGQVQYLKLTEVQMSIFSGVFNIGQLFAVGVLSRTVNRKGADYAFTFAGLGLMSCPVSMIVCSLLPHAARMLAFTAMVCILNAPQCAINLCVVQILLRVAPKQCRNMTVTLFTLTTTLTNCIMPFLGVQLYTALGANFRALLVFNGIVFVLRTFTTLLLLWRYRNLRRIEGNTVFVG